MKFALQNETCGFILQGMKRSYEELLGRYLEIFPCVVVNNDCTTRLYTEKLVGIPFHWL